MIALVQTAVGKTQQALESLTRACERGDMCYREVNPSMDPLRNNSRFLTLSRRIGLFTLTRLETHIGQSVFLSRSFWHSRNEMGLFIGFSAHCRRSAL